jgi:uncharacterized membrane protein
LEGWASIVDEEVTAVVLALILIVGVFAVAQPFFANRVVDPFSELAILGPNKKIGDYPKSLVAGEKFTLFIYVGNHEGSSTYYRVYAKLGNRSSTINANVSLTVAPMAQYDVILQNNQTWLQPTTLQIDTAAINHRLVFELWRYRPQERTFVYDSKWVQLWLNVTRPD